MKGLLPLLLWGEVERRVAVAGWDRQQGGEQGNGLAEVIGSLSKHHLKPIEPLVVGIVASKFGCPFELGDARIQCTVLMVR
jgi:hypothetical protein